MINDKDFFDFINEKSINGSSEEYLNRIIDEELEKTEEEIDADLIEYCIDLLTESDDAVSITAEEKDKGDTNDKRIKFKYKRIIVIAAVIIAFITGTLSASAVVFDINLFRGIVEEAHGLYNTNNNTDINLIASGLITYKSLTLTKTTNSLKITAETVGTTDVKKCGFTYIKLQRLINGSWTDYSAYCYYDQYNESYSKNFEKTISAPKGYTYRVICEHFAEKTKLLIFKETETSYNEISSLYF